MRVSVCVYLRVFVVVVGSGGADGGGCGGFFVVVLHLLSTMKRSSSCRSEDEMQLSEWKGALELV